MGPITVTEILKRNPKLATRIGSKADKNKNGYADKMRYITNKKKKG